MKSEPSKKSESLALRNWISEATKERLAKLDAQRERDELKAAFEKLEAQRKEKRAKLIEKLRKRYEESALLQMPMIGLDETALEYGRTAGLIEAWRIVSEFEEEAASGDSKE